MKIGLGFPLQSLFAASIGSRGAIDSTGVPRGVLRDERLAHQFELRLFFDRAFLRSVQRAQAWARIRKQVARLALLAALTLLAAGYTGTVVAEDGYDERSQETTESEPTSGSDSEGESWSLFDWIFSTMGDEGGSNDPEGGIG